MADAAGQRTRSKGPLLIWLAACVILLAASWQQIASLSGWDPDDQLRLVQLRDFLNGQGWFDNSQHRLNTPFGSDMHWSRLIELPLAGLVLIFSPIFGQHAAEMIAGSLMPLLLLLATGWLLGDITGKLGKAAAAPVAMLACVITPTLLAQYMPMRIDHHGWQIMLACLSLWTLFRVDDRKYGLLLGGALALWLHISLEGAPLMAAFFGWLGWQWAFRGQDGRRLFWTIAAFGGISALFFLAATPWQSITAIWCDALTLPHLAAIAAGCLVMLPATFLLPRASHMRVASVLIAAAAATAAFWVLAPQCAGGAFAQIDPLVRSYWYAGVTEGLPVWRQADWSAAGWILPALVGCLLLPAIRRSQGVRSEHFAPLAFFQLASLMIALFVFRASGVASAFAIPALAIWLRGILERYRMSREPAAKIRLALLMFLVVMAGPLWMQMVKGAGKLFPQDSKAAVLQSDLSSRACQTAMSVESLASLEKARIVASFDMGPAILLTSRNSVLASSHHRNQQGMHDQIMLFRSSPDAARKIVEARGITHFAICPGEAEMQQYQLRDPGGLGAMLATGKQPEWLERMADRGQGIQLWRVRQRESDAMFQR